MKRKSRVVVRVVRSPVVIVLCIIVIKSSTKIEMKKERSTHQWKPKCFSCGQKEHFQRDCPSPKRKEEKLTKHNAKPAKESATFDSDIDESYNSVFTASSNQSPSEQWLIDSGATSHNILERVTTPLSQVQCTADGESW